MNIAIVYSLPTPRAKQSAFSETDEDTVASAKEIQEALHLKHHTVVMVGVACDAIEKTIRGIHADMIINLIDWTGPDLLYSIQAVEALEKTGIPCVGAQKETYIRTSNKVGMKKVLQAAGISTPWWQTFTTGIEPIDASIPYPVIVKLADEHCSVGLDSMSVVSDASTLRTMIHDRIKRFGRMVFAEAFVNGREFQVTLLEGPDGVQVLPPAEIFYRVTGAQAILTYKSRWDEKDPDFHTSYIRKAKLDWDLWNRIQILCLATWKTFHFTDFTRIDMRMKNNTVYVLEVNSNPGLGDDDLTGMTIAYKAIGMTFADFMDAIIASCARRNRLSLQG